MVEKEVSILEERKSRFRIRNGEIEIEYEGPVKEANIRYESAFEWLTSQQTKKLTKKKGKSPEKKAKGKRGGARRALYTPKITEFVEEDFFANRKSLDEVIKALVPKNVPTRGRKARNAILTNLKRRIAKRGSRLKGASEEGVWYFWVD